MSKSLKNLSKTLVALGVIAGMASPLLAAPKKKARGEDPATPGNTMLEKLNARVEGQLPRVPVQPNAAQPDLVEQLAEAQRRIAALEAGQKPTTPTTEPVDDRNMFQKADYYADELVIEGKIFEDYMLTINCGEGGSGNITKKLEPGTITLKLSSTDLYASRSEETEEFSVLSFLTAGINDFTKKQWPLAAKALKKAMVVIKDGEIEEPLSSGFNCLLRIWTILESNLDANTKSMEFLTLISRYKKTLQHAGMKDAVKESKGEIQEIIEEILSSIMNDQKNGIQKSLDDKGFGWVWDFFKTDHTIELSETDKATLAKTNVDMTEKAPIATKLALKAIWNMLDKVAKQHATLMQSNGAYKDKWNKNNDKSKKMFSFLENKEGKEAYQALNNKLKEMTNSYAAPKGKITLEQKIAHIEKILELRNKIEIIYLEEIARINGFTSVDANETINKLKINLAKDESRVKELNVELKDLLKNIKPITDIKNEIAALNQKIAQQHITINETRGKNPAGKELYKDYQDALRKLEAEMEPEDTKLNDLLAKMRAKTFKIAHLDTDKALNKLNAEVNVILDNPYPTILTQKSLFEDLKEKLADKTFATQRDEFKAAIVKIKADTGCDSEFINLGFKFLGLTAKPKK